MASYPNVQPIDLPMLNTHGVFQAIQLHAQWELIGSQYLEQLGLNTVPQAPSHTVGGFQSRDDSSNRGEPPAENRTISNPTFNADLFNQYREDRTSPAQEVRHNWEAAGVQLPRSCVDSSRPMCLAYHVKGRCNTGCGASYDHAQYSVSTGLTSEKEAGRS